MVPGPQIVYKCPNCEHLTQQGTIRSGNTIGATFYSDGKYDAPMMSDILQFNKCRKCETFYWFEGSHELIRYELSIEGHPLQHVESPQLIRIEDFHKALERSIYRTYGEIIYIRQRLMWAYNDQISFNKKPQREKIKDYRHYDNLKILMENLFMEKPYHIMLASEIHRNLGEFEKSISLLRALENENYNDKKAKLMQACHQGYRNVLVF